MLNPKALVTGASEGIGRALALALARAGYSVTAVARNEARLDELLGELVGDGHRALPADLATTEGIALVAAALGQEHHQVLANNAAFGAVGRFDERPLEQQLAMIRTNCEAVVALAHAFLRASVSGDTLINISSIVAFIPQPAQPVYTATKAFVSGFSETLWAQQRARGVNVIAVHPGLTDTRFSERSGRDPRRARPRTLRQVPEEVVAVTMRALHQRRGPHVLSGRINWISTLAARLLPRRFMLALMGRAG